MTPENPKPETTNPDAQSGLSSASLLGITVEHFFKTHYAPKTITGPCAWAITIISVKRNKNRVSLSWSLPSYFMRWWFMKTWLFHVLWKSPFFEQELYQIKILGTSLRYEEDHSHEIPEHLRGFIATTETLYDMERMLRGRE